jgi:hypothetical protein
MSIASLRNRVKDSAKKKSSTASDQTKRETDWRVKRDGVCKETE